MSNMDSLYIEIKQALDPIQIARINGIKHKN